MKKVLFIFNIAIALFALNSFSAYGAENGLSCRTLAHDFAVLDMPSPSNDSVFDVCFEDIADDDDDSNDDTEGKKKPLEKTTKSNLSFIPHCFSANRVTRYASTQLYFPLKTSLFIFIGVLRI